MTQEEKELLLIDLCARLPYGITCQFTWTYCNETTDGEEVIAKEDDNIRGIDIHTKEIQADYYGEWVDLGHCKPYLRPLSSMTEKEREEYKSFFELFGKIPVLEQDDKYFDFLNSHHFDYRGLIEKGIALEAPEGMYKNE